MNFRWTPSVYLRRLTRHRVANRALAKWQDLADSLSRDSTRDRKVTGLLDDAREEQQPGTDQAYREFLPLLGEGTLMGPGLSWLAADDRRRVTGVYT